MKNNYEAGRLNEGALLYIKGHNKNGKQRYLACDPAEIGVAHYTWTTDLREAVYFRLERLPEMLEIARGRPFGSAVKLATTAGICTLAERERTTL